MKTYAEQLDDVQKAIEAVEKNGLEYEIDVNGNGRRIRRADLGTLYKREAWLKQMIHRECGGGYTPIIPI